MTCNKKIFLTPQPLAGNGFGLGEGQGLEVQIFK